MDSIGTVEKILVSANGFVVTLLGRSSRFPVHMEIRWSIRRFVETNSF